MEGIWQKTLFTGWEGWQANIEKANKKECGLNLAFGQNFVPNTIIYLLSVMDFLAFYV